MYTLRTSHCSSRWRELQNRFGGPQPTPLVLLILITSDMVEGLFGYARVANEPEACQRGRLDFTANEGSV